MSLLKKTTKTLGLLSATYGLFLIGEHITLLYKEDVSLQTPYFQRMPVDQTPQAKPFVTLISYADGHPIYFKNQMGQVHAALNKGFDRFILYRREHLDSNFYIQNKQILDQKRGAGVWLWKPYILCKTLEHLPENSVVVYTDAPTLFIKPVDKYLTLMGDNDVLLVEMRNDAKGQICTAGETINQENLARFGLDTPDVWAKTEIRTCFYIVRNTPRGRHFAQKWLEISSRPEVLLRTDYDPENQHHNSVNASGCPEQDTIFITKELYPEGVKTIPWSEWKGNVINVWRKNNADSKERQANPEWFSFVPEFAGLHKVSHFGYNATWMVWVRDKIASLKSEKEN